jgi:hypothetical protein
VTIPVVAPATILDPPLPPPEPVRFPLQWLLDHASAPVQYRAIVDVAKIGAEVPDGVRDLPYTHHPALELALQADRDGVWNQAMLTVPAQRASHFEGVGTIKAFRRLTEYGWDKDSPPLIHSRRILFRMLAEDHDPALLYELAPTRGKVEEEVLHAYRQSREAAGAALAGAGFESDPRLRGLAARTIERIADYLRSPLAEKPWIRVGNKQVLDPEAFPPSIHALHLVAHMPLFQAEHYEAMALLYEYLTRPLPRQDAVQLVGTELMPIPFAVLGDMLPHRNAVEGDIPFALAWLELMARLGFLQRNENWRKMYERFIEDSGRDGVWHPRKGMAMPRSANTYVWPMFPLEETHGGDERWCDVTFRVGLIARLSGRPVELI